MTIYRISYFLILLFIFSCDNKLIYSDVTFETDSYNRISCEETARLVFEDTLWENWYNDID